MIEPKPSIGEVDPNTFASAFEPSVGACHTVKPAMDASSGTSSTRRAFVTVAVLFVCLCARFDDDDDGKEDDEREESAASTREGAHATCIFYAAFFLLLAVCAARVIDTVVRYFCVGEFGNF